MRAIRLVHCFKPYCLIPHEVRGDLFDGAETPLDMPESCLLPPDHDPMSLIVPSTEVRHREILLVRGKVSSHSETCLRSSYKSSVSLVPSSNGC